MRVDVIATIGLLLVLSAAQGQTPVESSPTIRTSTRLVEVAVVPTRGNDSPVENLDPSALRVFDNGKPQTIVSFEPIGSGSTGFSEGSSDPSAANGDLHHCVILLDALNTSLSDQAYARNAVMHLLDYAPPGERIALFVLSDHLYFLNTFTSDAVQLRSRLKRFSSPPPNDDRAPESGDRSSLSADVSFPQVAAYSTQMHLLETGSSPEARFYQRERILQTLDALRTIAGLLTGIQGQKDLLWVSGGFPLMVHGGRSEFDTDTYADQEGKTARTLSSAGLRIFPIDARGLTISPQAYVNIETMQEIANDTGGKAFYNNNDLVSLMRQALQETREGYLLTYSPNDLREDGSFHKIRIRMSLTGVKLHYRPGYYADMPPSLTSEKQRSEHK